MDFSRMDLDSMTPIFPSEVPHAQNHLPGSEVLMTPFDGNQKGSFPVVRRVEHSKIPSNNAQEWPRNDAIIERRVRLWVWFLLLVICPFVAFLVVLLGDSL